MLGFVADGHSRYVRELVEQQEELLAGLGEQRRLATTRLAKRAISKAMREAIAAHRRQLRELDACLF